MLAEQVVLHEDGVVPIPPYMSYEEAATLTCAAVTSWQALVSKGGMKAGDTVLVQGHWWSVNLCIAVCCDERRTGNRYF